MTQNEYETLLIQMGKQLITITKNQQKVMEALHIAPTEKPVPTKPEEVVCETISQEQKQTLIEKFRKENKSDKEIIDTLSVL